MKNRQARPILSGPSKMSNSPEQEENAVAGCGRVETQFEFRVEKNALFDEPMNQPTELLSIAEAESTSLRWPGRASGGCRLSPP